MSYKLLNSGGVQRLADHAFIPPTLDNLDWVQYQAWLALGNTPQPADPFVPLATAAAGRERERNLEKLDRAVADADQASVNHLVLKLLKDRP